MAIAAFKLVKCTGTSAGTETDTSKKPTFLSADVHDANPANYPIAIPQTLADPAVYSFECWLRWECTTAPDNYCQNFKVWGPSSRPGNGITIYFGTTGTAATPTANQSSVATVRQDTNYYSAGTALAIGVVPGDSKINAVGEKTNYLVGQLKAEYGAASSNIETQPFNFGYEEA